MQRASITFKVERDGEVLAEHVFGQDEPNLDDLREMFMATLFHRIQKLGNEVFDMADERAAEMEAEEQRKLEEAEAKKNKKKSKPAKKKAAAKKETADSEPAGQDAPSDKAEDS